MSLLQKLLLLGALLLAFSAPGCGRGAPDSGVLRFATTQMGERMRPLLRSALADFERANPGVRVELLEIDGEVYQRMGLVTLFLGRTPPDVYFQWGGHLVEKYAAAGYALELSPWLAAEDRERYHPACWASTLGADGGTYLWPMTASVTTLLWYRPEMLPAAGPPETWEQFLAIGSRLREQGIVPLAVGNKELWPGGNFAAYMAAHQAGVDRYRQILGLAPGTRLDDPAFVAAFERLGELEQRGFFNRGLNGVGTEEARSLLAQGKAAMHPIGDWLVSEVDEEQAGQFDAFRLPHLPGQQAPDALLLALSTGYMVNRRTAHPDQAAALLRHLASDEVQRAWTRAGHVSALRTIPLEADAPVGQHRIRGFLDEVEATALAPDVGFDLEVSDAFLDAAALVLGGRATPREALAAAERQVRAMRDDPRFSLIPRRPGRRG
jgi:raffinose/stachyose/melibiose transport system substrate-binding protein